MSKAFASPEQFRRSLIVDGPTGPVRFGDVMNPFQEDDFRALDAAWLRVTGWDPDTEATRRLWSERPRGHAKSSDAAIAILWCLSMSRREVSGIAGAVDKDQSRLLLAACARLMRLNPWLSASGVEVLKDEVVNKRTGSRLKVISSDVAGSWGYLPHFVICDEVCHWKTRDLFDSMLSSAGKKADSIALCISNAGYTPSWQFDVREAIRQDPAWHFSKLSGPTASWITEEQLAEQKRLLRPNEYARLWNNEWSSGASDALDADDIKTCTVLAGPSEWEPQYRYYGGLDLSISKDWSSLCVVAKHVGGSYVTKKAEPKPVSHLSAVLVDLGFAQSPVVEQDDHYEYVEPSGKTKLVHLQNWKPKPKIDLVAVEESVIRAHETFGLDVVLYDQYQAESLAQRCRRRGIRMLPFNFTQTSLTELAAVVLSAFADRTVELWPHELLLSQLAALKTIEKVSGAYRLDSPRTSAGGHGDAAMSFALALCCASRYRPAPTLSRELIHADLVPDEIPGPIDDMDDVDAEYNLLTGNRF